MDRRGQLLKLKKERRPEIAEGLVVDEDLTDVSLKRLQKLMDEQGTGGLACFDESATDETLDEYQRRRQENVNKYKQSLMNEYEEEMRRKHQIQMHKAAKLNKDDPLHQYIPSNLGKADPSLTKMS